MPWLKGTTADVQEVGWRGTLLMAADLNGKPSRLSCEDITMLIRKRLTVQSWQMVERLVREHHYPIGVLRAELLDNTLGIPPAIELYCVLAIRTLHEEYLGLDEIEDLAAHAAERIQGELELMLGRGLSTLADEAVSSVVAERNVEDN